MSIAAYKRLESIRADIYYTDIKGRNIKVFPTFENNDLTVMLTLDEYLKSYGLTIRNTIKQLKDKETSELMLQWFITNKENETFRKTLNFLRDYRKNGIKLDEIKNYNIDELKEFVQKLPFKLKNEKEINKDEVKYITGEWFEEYVYYNEKEEKKLDDVYIKNSAVIEKKIPDAENKMPNEFDVIYIYRNKLYIIECKTSIANEKEDIFNETAYKISALRRNFGLNVDIMIYTLDNLRDENGELKNKYNIRSKGLEIKVKDMKDIIK